KGRVLLPVLGDQYGAVLEAGAIVPRFDPAEGSFSLWYYEHRFPLSPLGYAAILRDGGEALAELARAFAGLRRYPRQAARDRAATVWGCCGNRTRARRAGGPTGAARQLSQIAPAARDPGISHRPLAGRRRRDQLSALFQH